MSGISVWKVRVLYGFVLAVFLATFVGVQPVDAAQTCTTRYYLSTLVGAGTDEDSLRPSLSDFAFRGNGYPHKAWVGTGAVYAPADPETGWPILPWTFAVVSSYNQNLFLRDKQSAGLPDAPLTTALSDFSARELEELRDAMVQFGIDTSILETAVTYYDVIWFIGQTLAGSQFYIPSGNCPS